MKVPLITDIRGNSLDDGPGIRTIIFFKGCSLGCTWCHNPETRSIRPELSVSRDECIGCGNCVSVCPQGAISPLHPEITDRKKCILCFQCTGHCPAKARRRVGVSMTIEEILEICLSDKPFYDVSGGGVTFSGGEPGIFPEWTGELAGKLKENGISVYMETAGCIPYGEVRTYLLPYLSGIYMDIKLMDPELHKRYCGRDNREILENFRYFLEDSEELGYEFLSRTPLIPGITDTEDNLRQIAAFYHTNGVTRTQLLPYNPTWYPKAEKLGIRVGEELSGLHQPQSMEYLQKCRKIFEEAGITCI